MKLQRLFGIFFILCLVFSLAAPASAAGKDASLEQAIIDACTFGEEVNISQHKLTEEALDDIFDKLYYSGVLPWYTTGGYNYAYDEQTGLVYSMEPETVCDGDPDMAAYEEKVAQILEACVFEGMEQWQIALSIHDYLIANTAYDETMEKNTGYDILVNSSAVCEGYTLAYMDLLQRAGIECIYVGSEAMNHCWNLVKIDGSWYHVDLTWDDPTPNIAGYVSHEYFLLTDAEIAAGDEPHHGWQTDITCTDTRFKDGFWRETESQICYDGSNSCYLIRTVDWINHIYHRNDHTGKQTLLYKEKEAYVDIGQGDYIYAHQGLTLRAGRLWFNTMTKLLSMSTDGSGIQTEYTHSGNTYIYSSHVSGDTAALALMDHSGEGSAKEVSVPPADEHIHSFTRTATLPTCTENGWTESLCSCGLSAQSTPAKAAGHDYSQTDSKEATLFSDGFATHTCAICGDNYTEQLSKLDLADFLADNFKIIVLAIIAVASLLRAVLRGRKRA